MKTTAQPSRRARTSDGGRAEARHLALVQKGMESPKFRVAAHRRHAVAAPRALGAFVLVITLGVLALSATAATAFTLLAPVSVAGR